MNVNLKKLSIYERMSEETTAFVADVYVDGKKVGYAQNDGHGGETMINWERAIGSDRIKEIEAELKKAVPAEYASFTQGITWAVDQAVEASRKEKEDKRIAKAIAKNDAAFKASAAKRGAGWHAARFEVPMPGGTDYRWVEFKDGQEETARAALTKKYGTISNWTVLA